jgi:hypothetical protein
MTREDIIRLAREACRPDAPFRQYVGGVDCGLLMKDEHLERFAALVAAAERDRMKSEGWRQCAEGQRTTQYCGLLEEAVKAEREACIKAVEDNEQFYRRDTIRARGENK